jgi:uncharacterized DUF497 family protein
MKIEYDNKKQQVTLKERGLDFEDTPIIFAGSPGMIPVKIMGKSERSH